MRGFLRKWRQRKLDQLHLERQQLHAYYVLLSRRLAFLRSVPGGAPDAIGLLDHTLSLNGDLAALDRRIATLSAKVNK